MKLTIAIPTYKRPELLKKCLSSIFKQANADWVDVLVFDDSVSDENDCVYNWARLSYANFNVKKNERNVGIDCNIQNCLNSTPDGYLLVLGEDDILMPDAIKNIDLVVQSEAPDIIFTNYLYMDNELNNIIREPFSSYNVSIPPATFVQDYMWAVGFIGSVVISTSMIQHQDVNFLGSYFNHVGRIAMAITPETKIFSAPLPLVGNRSEGVSSTTWSSSFYDVMFGFERLMVQLSNTAPLSSAFLDAKECFKRRMGYHSLYRILEMRGLNVYNSHSFGNFFSSSYSNQPVRRAICKAISSIPVFCLTPYVFLCRLARKVKQKFFY